MEYFCDTTLWRAYCHDMPQQFRSITKTKACPHHRERLMADGQNMPRSKKGFFPRNPVSKATTVNYQLQNRNLGTDCCSRYWLWALTRCSAGLGQWSPSQAASCLKDPPHPLVSFDTWRVTAACKTLTYTTDYTVCGCDQCQCEGFCYTPI